MHVVMLASECAPAAKVGGLGDVVHGLSQELVARGHRVEIILPKYDCLRLDRVEGLALEPAPLSVPWQDGSVLCEVYSGLIDGLDCRFIAPGATHPYFQRGRFYGSPDDVERFTFFSRAALEWLHQTGARPDVLHCHDWQTALAPVLLYEIYERLGMDQTRVCFTLHNLAHQGLTDAKTLSWAGLNPASLLTPDRLLDARWPGAVNLMKGGIVYSNHVTTVSPTYAREVMSSALGMGLEPTLAAHQDKFSGILNGIDHRAWDPARDPRIAAPFDAATLDKKYENKRALRARLGLREGFKPLVASIGRLDPQKGVDLIRQAIPYCLNSGAQFVLLGSSPVPEIQRQFEALRDQYESSADCRLELAYNEELSRLIYAGADLILVPSRYEPCGLTQLIALRYGTIPVVRRTGGLADTVVDAGDEGAAAESRNGYLFADYSWAGFEPSLRRALGLWFAYPWEFRDLIVNAMRCDFSWRHPAAEYEKIYQRIRP